MVEALPPEVVTAAEASVVLSAFTAGESALDCARPSVVAYCWLVLLRQAMVTGAVAMQEVAARERMAAPLARMRCRCFMGRGSPFVGRWW